MSRYRLLQWISFHGAAVFVLWYFLCASTIVSQTVEDTPNDSPNVYQDPADFFLGVTNRPKLGNMILKVCKPCD